jgi:hypothetical protein
MDFLPPKATQADYATLYRLKVSQDSAVVWMKSRAARAYIHWTNQLDCKEWMVILAARLERAAIATLAAFHSLKLSAELAIIHCTKKDDTFGFLNGNYLKYLILFTF